MTKHSPKSPLGADQLEALIAPFLVEVLSRSRSLPNLIDTLVPLAQEQQSRVLHWIEVISRTNAELAFQFAMFAPRALEKMTLPEIDEWVLHAMNIYDHQGLYTATNELKHVDRYIRERHQRNKSLQLESVRKVLEGFLQGLSGRHLAIEADNDPWTDTDTVYLPKHVSLFKDPSSNFILYKSMSALIWAQTWFGTFALNSVGTLKLNDLAEYDDPELATAIFMSLETERLLYRIAIELPGLGRQMLSLAGDRKLDAQWEQQISNLQADTATVDETLEAVAQLYPSTPPTPLDFQPKLRVPEASQIIQARIDHEREKIKHLLEEVLPESLREQMLRREREGSDETEEGLQLRVVEKLDSSDTSFELSFHGTAFAATPELNQLLLSILQDLGEIPLDYLVAGGTADPRTPQATPVEIPRSDEDAENGLPYPEWDHRRGSYRQDWCYLRETEVEYGPENYVATTLAKYSAVLPRLRKSFEALRGEDRWLRRQLSGDEIDIDAAVDAIADSLSGREPSERLYTRLSRIDRNIAVMLMIDMSGSTKGWVNDAEREALVLLCQALEILGDRYAIYGFSGMTRKRCDLYRIKEFSETYSSDIERRISGISAKDYTRMGVTIRHLNKLLEATPAKTKLLITLSDGKPEDFDGYGGEYGIEDTRQALIESRRLGIHPFCITIDTEASSYLPHMYGAYNYAVVDNVRDLPLRVADVYRRLTH